MYILTRKINGIVEVLKDSSVQTDKIFLVDSEAKAFADKLNMNIVRGQEWSVMREDEYRREKANQDRFSLQ